MQAGPNQTNPLKLRDYPYYKQVWNRVILTLLAVSFIPLLAIGGGVYFYAAATLKARALDALRFQAVNHQKVIDRFLTERQDDLKLIAELNSLETLLSSGRLQQIFDVLHRQIPCFQDLGVIDSLGNHRAYVGPYSLLSRNYRDTDWFREVMERGAYISDVFLGYREVPHFVMAIKQVSPKGAWILRATVDSNYFDVLVGDRSGELKTDAFLVNREGLLQTRPRSGGNLLEPSTIRPEEKPGELQLEETSGRLIVTLWQTKVPWLSVVQVERAEIYRALDRVRFVALSVFIVGGMLLVVAILLVTGRLISRLEAKGRRLRVLDEELRRVCFLSASMELSLGFFQEIKDILTNIDASAAWLEEASTEPDGVESTDTARQIQAQTARGLALTDKLLHFMRPAAPQIGDVSINGLLDDLLSFLQKELELRGIRLVRDYQEPLPVIRSDSTALRQAFQNLLLNAVAAVDKDGEIRLNTRLQDGAVQVVVSDSGPGIDDEIISRIFEPLFTTKPHGAGLGLAICRDLLEKLGAVVSVASTGAAGTSFVVTLPIRFIPGGSRSTSAAPEKPVS